MNVSVDAAIHGVVLGSAYGGAGVTFGIFYRISKVFHIAFASIGSLGAVVAVVVSGSTGGWFQITAAIALGVVVAAVATGFLYYALYRPLVRRGATSGITFISSLGASLLISAIVAIVAGPQDRTFNSGGFTQQSEYAGISLSGLHVAALVSLILVATVSVMFLRRTRAGRQTQALISSSDQAELVGIRVKLLSILVCGGVGGLSVLAFVIQGLNSTVSLAAGLPLTLFGVLAMMCGGVDNVIGTAVAGLLIGVVGALSASLVPGQWSSTIVFVLAMVFIVLRPSGGLGGVRAA